MLQARCGRTDGSQALVEEFMQFEQVVGVVLQPLHLLFLGQVRLTLTVCGQEGDVIVPDVCLWSVDYGVAKYLVGILEFIVVEGSLQLCQYSLQVYSGQCRKYFRSR